MKLRKIMQKSITKKEESACCSGGFEEENLETTAWEKLSMQEKVPLSTEVGIEPSHASAKRVAEENSLKIEKAKDKRKLLEEEKKALTMLVFRWEEKTRITAAAIKAQRELDEFLQTESDMSALKKILEIKKTFCECGNSGIKNDLGIEMEKENSLTCGTLAVERETLERIVRVFEEKKSKLTLCAEALARIPMTLEFINIEGAKARLLQLEEEIAMAWKLELKAEFYKEWSCKMREDKEAL